MLIKGHTSIIMLMYAPYWLRPLKSDEDILKR